MPNRLAWYTTAYGIAPDCVRCDEYMSQPLFAVAVSSVSISHRITRAAAARAAVDNFHDHGHPEGR